MATLHREIVSVAIATYNGQDYLREQLDSILQQTIMPDEIVISDDGSTDETIEIINKYIDQFPNIILYHNVEKHGAEGNFQNAFKHCKGDIIFPSDQDDVWVLNKIEKILNTFTDNIEIVYAQDEIFDEKGIIGQTSWSIPKQHKAMWKNTLAGHSCAFRKNILNRYKPTRKLSWDYEICLYGSMNYSKVKGISDCLVKWRRHSNTLTHSTSEKYKDIPQGKYARLSYAIKNCRKQYSIPFYEYMIARRKFISSINGNNCHIISVLSQQKWYSFVLAGCLYAVLEMFYYKSGSFRNFLRHLSWAFCYPAVFWCEMHREKWIT